MDHSPSQQVFRHSLPARLASSDDGTAAADQGDIVTRPGNGQGRDGGTGNVRGGVERGSEPSEPSIQDVEVSDGGVIVATGGGSPAAAETVPDVREVDGARKPSGVVTETTAMEPPAQRVGGGGLPARGAPARR